MPSNLSKSVSDSINSGISPEILNQVNQLQTQQLIWLSGYCSGLAAFQQSRGEPGFATLPTQAEPVSQINALVLFASQTGNAESIAENLHQGLAQKGIKATLASTLDVKLRSLKDYAYIFVVASTHGEGEPPDDAIDFHEQIFGRKAPKLENVEHAVLALGDSSYEFYCKTGKDFDEALTKLGSKALKPVIECDVDFADPAAQWVSDIVSLLAKQQEQDKSVAKVVQLEQYQKTTAKTYTKTDPATAEILTLQKITSRDSVKNTYHIEIDLLETELSYQPGDSLGIIAPNDAGLVAQIIEKLSAQASDSVILKDETFSLEKVLTDQLELTLLNKPSLTRFADLTGSEQLKSELENDSTAFIADNQWLDVLHLAEQLPAPQQFVDLLKPIKPRLYSISSSQTEVESEVHLTVNLNTHTNARGVRNGLASHYLIERLQEGDAIKVYVDPNKNFKLPGADKPVIMIGPGTGIAPFRAFLQERDNADATGKNWLFFGNPNFQHDFLYQTEFKKYLKSGHLNKISLAFSRDQQEKVYVQHRLQQEASEVWQWIHAEQASIYVCGDMSRMAKDVEQSLLAIFSEQGELNQEQAAEYLKQLKIEKRYQRDVY